MQYVTTSFSPMMLKTGLSFVGQEVTIEKAKKLINEDTTSAVSHENTAKLLSSLFGLTILFNRVKLVLEPGDIIICIIPNFRTDQSREFTEMEISEEKPRAFKIIITRKSEDARG